MRTSLVLVSQSYARLAGWSLRLSGQRYGLTLIHAKYPVTEAHACPRPPDAMLVELQGDENVLALRSLLEHFERTRVLFTVPSMPPSAAVARIVRSHGGVLLSSEEPDVIMTATLIALAVQSDGADRDA